MSISRENIPYVEKYRPNHFDDIILEPLNKKILKKIIDTIYFPNLLFYGPPGTGKTTTIINLINSYQERMNEKNKDLVIHLNASDERGIDIIRNQINFFVNSKPLFNKGTKFVILDEVDYMTKNAQQALRYLLQTYNKSVRFCLICNYISRIDEGLQNEFVKLRFNQLPQDDIIRFLKYISDQEALGLSHKSLQTVQSLFKSDIRSMINFIQSNRDNLSNMNIVDDSIWIDLLTKLQQGEKIEIISRDIYEISKKYNIDKKNIIKYFFNYIIRNYKSCPIRISINSELFLFIENVIHSENLNNNIYVNYSLSRLQSFISK
jgi:DNA polymerase III delta prime subunit